MKIPAKNVVFDLKARVKRIWETRGFVATSRRFHGVMPPAGSNYVFVRIIINQSLDSFKTPHEAGARKSERAHRPLFNTCWGACVLGSNCCNKELYGSEDSVWVPQRFESSDSLKTTAWIKFWLILASGKDTGLKPIQQFAFLLLNTTV